jgi:Fe-S-cluster containining protein
MTANHSLETTDELRQEVVEGLRYVHHQLGANTGKALETASFLYALIELLMKKGLLTEEELNEKKVDVAKRLVEKFRALGVGAVLQDPEYDKYGFGEKEVKIDCENRIPLCKAACCRLNFALSRQDIEEGIVRWDLGRPYMIAQDADGYCRHLDRGAHCCTVYANRPVPCRAYDCRKDKRIWLDFENKIVNPNLEELFKKGTNDHGAANGGSKPVQVQSRNAASSQSVEAVPDS